MKRIAILMTLVILVFINQPILSQATNQSAESKLEFGLEIRKPSLNEWDFATFATFGAFLSIENQFSQNKRLLIDLPFAQRGYNRPETYADGSPYERPAVTTIGNPYLGLRLGNRNNSNTTGQIGIRIPFASEEKWQANRIGELADPERLGAFISNALTLSTGINYFPSKSSSTDHRWSFGLTSLIPTKNYGDPELLATYGYQFELTSNGYSTRAGLSGFMLLTESDTDLSEKFYNFLHFEIGRSVGQFHPMLNISVPLNERYKNHSKLSFGLKLNLIIENQ